jgi:hypothetical protein
MNSQNPLKFISPSMFAVIIICFFLPFTTVSCQNTPVVTMTGYQLATGTTIEKTSGLGNSLTSGLNSLASLSGNSASSKAAGEQKVPGTPLAGIILAMACAGVAVSFVAIRQQAMIQAAIGAIGTFLLLFLKSQVDEQTLKQGQGMLQNSYGMGYWGSLILFLGAAVFNGYRTWMDSQKQNKI